MFLWEITSLNNVYIAFSLFHFRNEIYNLRHNSSKHIICIYDHIADVYADADILKVTETKNGYEIKLSGEDGKRCQDYVWEYKRFALSALWNDLAPDNNIIASLCLIIIRLLIENKTNEFFTIVSDIVIEHSLRRENDVY